MKFKAGGNGGGNPHVIRLKSGEAVSGILRGDPYEYERAFKEGDKKKFRFRINLVTKVNGVLEAKILEGGYKLYKGLKELSESGWDLEQCFTRISRTGSGVNDTVYSASTLPNKPDPETLAAVAKVTLKELSEGLPGASSQASGPTSEDDMPF